MDIQSIKQLIKIVEKSDIDEIEFEEEGRKIRISKRTLASKDGSAQSHMFNPVYAAPPQPVPAPTPPAATEAQAPAASANTVEVRSPMVGTFYRSPSPEADPYVEVGSSIKPGSPLCIIEAMKLMNEIESEFSGKIVKIMLENAQPVEYNQVLFLVEKNG
ncbi:MAG: acetyl-CoA carboxylase biotin carboxyl carrier protein [Calditrichaeota bacterium]|nr:acetyl-CoA carboxylase biotin carboxyl carrier protein [Calditrichota bacterium]MCB0298967.1 acetyl-CoA carboxylase biotin carboxyl carrier protein [Calditrichota bacterium]MCB9069288.1 acetyl-CoA carboxylase biotin carboxyl carrier protein [Calditrichia bacterium]